MVAKTATGGAGRRAVATTKKARTAPKKPAAAKGKPAATTATLKRASTAKDMRQAAIAPSADFTSVMKTLERVRTKNDELEERISRLAASLA